MGTYLIKYLKNILAITTVLTVVCSCNLKSGNSGNSDKPVACFDYFNYKGNDDFYKQNPLPSADSYYNPILPGWYSDPSICRNGEDYFMVTSTFAYFPGVPIFHSRDLVNWEQIGHVLDRTSQLKLDGQRTSQGIFAPAISYNPGNQTYYMITTNVGAGNFFVKTKDPYTSWSDPVMLPMVHGIDPSFFFDDNGKAYIVNNDEPEEGSTYDGHRAIRIREFDVETEKTVGPEKVLVDGGIHPEEKPIWIEGPHMYKINGKYFLMAAEGGTGPQHSEVILRGDEPMGKFVAYKGNPILTQRQLDIHRPNPVTCAGHADLVQDQKGNWWSVFLACRPINGEYENLGRETFLVPVRWSDDGFPYITKDNELVPLIDQKEGITRNPNVTFGNFEKDDDFNATTLGLEWMTLRKPATDLYSLTEKKGKLTLQIADVSASERKVPAFVCRRIQHHKFEASTRLKLETSNPDEKAGILIYKDEWHQYFLAADCDGKNVNVSLQKISKDSVEVLAQSTFVNKKHEAKLKVESQGTSFDFYFAAPENDWELLTKDIDAYYLSTANSFGFTGTTIGMYATRQQAK